MEIISVKDYDELSKVACNILVKRMQEKERLVIGFATGSTPEGLYEQLIEKYKQQEISFKHVVSFNLDEYVGLDKMHPNNYYRYMKEKLFDYIDIPSKNIHIPNGVAVDLQAECEAYEHAIRKVGGIELQILGIGANGHIGFNEPGTLFTSRTQVVELTESTIEANSRFFVSKEEMPTQAISMGIGTIMESKEILLLASGRNKQKAVSELLRGNITDKVPATILQKHTNVTVIADERALS